MKVAILNCSDIARRRIIPAIKSIPELEVAIVLSRSLKKANEFAKEFDIPSYTDDIERVFELNPDIAYISSPPSEHYLMVSKCLERGINVICEKSLTTEEKHTNNLIEEAEQNGCLIQENYAFPFHPQWKYIVNSIKDIGTVTYINSGFEFPPRDKSKDFRYKKELGGGALLDAGGYPIKAASLLMDKLDLGEISGVNRTSTESGVDVSGNVFFVDERGVSAFLSWSFEAPYRCQLEIIGTEGKIKSNKIFTPKADETVIVERFDQFGKIVETREFKCDHFRELILDFIHRIKTSDNSHHKQIIKQSKWQSYAKTASLGTFVN